MPTWLKKRREQFHRTVKKWSEDSGNLIAAAMAYYAVLSIFPLLLLLISALGFALRFSSGAQDAQEELLNVLAQNTAPALAEHIKSALDAIRDKAPLGGPIGLIALGVASIGIFAHLDIAMARIWDTKRFRSGGVGSAVANALYYRLRAFLMLLALGILIWVAFIADTVASALRPFVADNFGGSLAWSAAHFGISLLINGALLTLLYKILPRARVRWTAALRGGALAAILWEISRQALTIVLMGKKFSAYGVVGSLLALMLWIYIASIIFFFAAEYVRVIYLDEKE